MSVNFVLNSKVTDLSEMQKTYGREDTTGSMLVIFKHHLFTNIILEFRLTKK